MEEKSHFGLPSISQLLYDSWDTFKKSVLHLIVFYLIILAISVVIIIAALAIIVGLGFRPSFLISFTGGQTDFNQLFTSLLAGILVILIPIFVIAFIIIGSIAQSGVILILDQSGKSISYSQILRKGSSLVLPLIGIGFLTSFIVLGGFFVFIIPAILFGFFFIFSTYEVILGDTNGTEALKRSYHIVSKMFFEVLGRFLLLVGIYILYWIFFTILTMLSLLAGDKVSSILYLIVTIANYIVSFGLSFFTASYIITLYKQAKTAVSPSEKVSIKWVWIVSIIGWVIAVFLLIASASFISNYVSSGAFKKALDKSKQTAIDQNLSANAVADEAFLKVNEYRQNNNLQVLEEDLKLCAYAQRRLEQLAKFGKWDDYKGFYEDTANNEIRNAYFNNYSDVNEAGYNVYSSTSSDKVINWWIKQENSLIKKSKYTHGCIRADESNLVFIVGVHK